MLDDFGNEMESTESKIDSTMKKVAKVLHMNNGESAVKLKFKLFVVGRITMFTSLCITNAEWCFRKDFFLLPFWHFRLL